MKKLFLILMALLVCALPALAEDTEADLAARYGLMPPLTPWGETPADIPAAEPAAVAEALNAPDGTLTFTTPDGVWPMILAEDDAGRSGLTSTNVLQDGSASAVTALIEAQAGDALAITFEMSSEAAFDRFVIRVDGEAVKVFSGVQARRTWAWAIPANGAYAVELAYEKDEADASGEDSLFLEEVALLTGDAAHAALAANPAYPVGNVTRLSAENGARAIGFDDPTFALTSLFGLADYCISPDAATLAATLAADVDPDAAYITIAGQEEAQLLSALAGEGRYALQVAADASSVYTAVRLYPHVGCDDLAVRTVVIFAGEAQVEQFIADCATEGILLNGWRYADGDQTD